jgi:hypothetical protein
VDAGQGDDEPGCRGDGRGGRGVDVVLAHRLQHGGGGAAPDLDAARGVAEDHAVGGAECEQGPERDEGVVAVGAVHRAQEVLDVVAGDLAEVVLAR